MKKFFGIGYFYCGACLALCLVAAIAQTAFAFDDPSSRVARLNWRLIHMASEGLFPQLIVIPLHRDHGVITMAAGKNDVIKLLPPLTLSEPEAYTFLKALDAVLTDCQRAAGRNWSVVRDIATATIRRRATPASR